MAVARIQERIGQTEYNAVTSMAQAPLSAFTSGSHIVVHTASWKDGADQSVSGVSGSVNGAYALGVAAPRIDSQTILYQYYKNNQTATTAETITVTWSVACAGGLTLVEYSGVKTAPTVTTGTASGSSTTMSSGAAAPGASSLYVAAGSYNTGGPCTIAAPGGSFTAVHEFDENNDSQDIAVAERLNVSGSQTCTWTLAPTATWTGLLVAYEEATGGETITIDKWHRPMSEPVRRRKVTVPV